MREEFKIAVANGVLVIPVGITGSVSKDLWGGSDERLRRVKVSAKKRSRRCSVNWATTLLHWSTLTRSSSPSSHLFKDYQHGKKGFLQLQI